MDNFQCFASAKSELFDELAAMKLRVTMVKEQPTLSLIFNNNFNNNYYTFMY